jgi:hypothetical protein
LNNRDRLAEATLMREHLCLGCRGKPANRSGLRPAGYSSAAVVRDRPFQGPRH